MADADGDAWLEAHKERAEDLIWMFYALALAAIAVAVPIKWPHAGACADSPYVRERKWSLFRHWRQCLRRNSSAMLWTSLTCADAQSPPSLVRRTTLTSPLRSMRALFTWETSSVAARSRRSSRRSSWLK